MPGERKHMMTDKRTFALYHANAKGTGSALLMGVWNANESEHSAGYLRIEMAAQKEINKERSYPSFDWEDAWGMKFGPVEIAQMLQVFDGITESVNDGKGFTHKGNNIQHRIWLRYRTEPTSGYALEVCRVKSDGVENRRTFVFTDAEALALSVALEGALTRICFA